MSDVYKTNLPVSRYATRDEVGPKFDVEVPAGWTVVHDENSEAYHAYDPQVFVSTILEVVNDARQVLGLPTLAELPESEAGGSTTCLIAVALGNEGVYDVHYDRIHVHDANIAKQLAVHWGTQAERLVGDGDDGYEYAVTPPLVLQGAPRLFDLGVPELRPYIESGSTDGSTVWTDWGTPQQAVYHYEHRDYEDED